MAYSTTSRSFRVYKISNSINDKLYIGVTTKSLQERMKRHIYNANRPRSAFHHALKKYGAENFSIELLEDCPDREHMLSQEIFWIQHYNTLAPHGYNTTTGGDGVNGAVLSEEGRQRLAIAAANRVPTPETLAKMRKNMHERLQSPEFVEKIRQGRLGKRASAEAREKMHLAKLGKKQSPETVQKRVAKNRGQKRSEESRKKMGHWQKGKSKAHSTLTTKQDEASGA